MDRKLIPNHISSNDDHSKKIMLRKNCSGWTIRANVFSLFFFLRLDKARFSYVFSPVYSGPPLLCGLGQRGEDGLNLQGVGHLNGKIRSGLISCSLLRILSA